MNLVASTIGLASMPRSGSFYLLLGAGALVVAPVIVYKTAGPVPAMLRLTFFLVNMIGSLGVLLFTRRRRPGMAAIRVPVQCMDTGNSAACIALTNGRVCMYSSRRARAPMLFALCIRYMLLSSIVLYIVLKAG